MKALSIDRYDTFIYYFSFPAKCVRFPLHDTNWVSRGMMYDSVSPVSNYEHSDIKHAARLVWYHRKKLNVSVSTKNPNGVPGVINVVKKIVLPEYLDAVKAKFVLRMLSKEEFNDPFEDE